MEVDEAESDDDIVITSQVRPTRERTVVAPPTPPTHETSAKRVWTWHDKKCLVAMLAKHGPGRRGIRAFIERCHSQHRGPMYPNDENGLRLVKLYWNRLLKEFKEKEQWTPTWKVTPADAKVLAVLVGPKASEAVQARAWRQECDTQEREWREVRAKAIEISSREILDDSDVPKTFKDVVEEVNEKKKERRQTREDAFKLLVEDAQRSNELKSAQLNAFHNMEKAVASFVQSNQAILQLLTKIMSAADAPTSIATTVAPTVPDAPNTLPAPALSPEAQFGLETEGLL